MYDVMNKYIGVNTWYTSHPADDERFYKALSEIVRNPDFSAEAMGDYLREKTDCYGNNEHNKVILDEINRRVTEAYAIRQFIILDL